MTKKTKKVEVEEPQVQEEVIVKAPPVVEEPKARERVKPSSEWEIKDRMYVLRGDQKPLSRTIKATDIYWFDEKKGYQRELK